MKIGLINGSPKMNGSASELFLEELKPFINTNNEIVSFEFHKPEIGPEQLAELPLCEALVFAFPLYVDSIPSHLLNCLSDLEETFSKSEKEITVYALVNCGFFEGVQNDIALEIMENWCKKAHLKWGQGIGIGGGPMMAFLKSVPMGHGPKKNLGHAFSILSNNILKGESGETLFVSPNFPRSAYIFSAHRGWVRQAKANGLKKKELSTKF